VRLRFSSVSPDQGLGVNSLHLSGQKLFMRKACCNRFCPASLYHGCMKTDIARKVLYKSIAAQFNAGWLLRRFVRENEMWQMEEWAGAAAKDDFPQAAGMISTLLSRPAMKNEIFMLLAKRSCPGGEGEIETAFQVARLGGHAEALEYVSSAAIFVEEIGILPPMRARPIDLSQWCEILTALPAMSRQIRQPAYLLLGGSDVPKLEIEANLTAIVNEAAEEGKFSSLAEVISSRRNKSTPFECKLTAMGVPGTALSVLRKHLDRISDSDIRESLQQSLLTMPWCRRATVERDLTLIRKRLDASLFGMEDAKHEVLAAIAGSLLSSSGVFHPPRILLHGKPGTGKTAMAKAVSEALGLPFQSLSMNGISTAVSIVGLEPFWRTPQAGKIIQSLIAGRVMNPLLLLDEIEKCGKSSEHGSPLDALLQVLDPTQNRTFCDLYMGLPVDLSEMFIVATANDITEVPEPLLDRFIVIEVPEYTLSEKRAIVPFLLNQIAAERELLLTPELGPGVMDRLACNLLPYVGLRQIKNCLWRMLCQEAMDCDDVALFKAQPVILHVHDSVLPCRKEEKCGIGFL